MSDQLPNEPQETEIEPEQEEYDMASKKDDFENERERVLGRGYNHMTDEEVGRDLIRRFGKDPQARRSDKKP